MKINSFANSVNTSVNTMVNQSNMSTYNTSELHRIEQHQEMNIKISEKIEKEKKQLSKTEAEHIVNGLNEFLEPHYTTISFELHEELDRYYVEVIDRETKEVIREIPDKELLDIYAKMTEFLGIFFDAKL